MGRFNHPNRHFLDIPLANGYGAPASASSHSRSLSAVAPLHLTSREESTRVQLQKQRLREQHHAVVVSQRIPGFKTSAGMSKKIHAYMQVTRPHPMSDPRARN